MKKTDIRICGMGGQGVIMSGMVLGRAATIFEDRWSTMIQSFGPEARGSTCSAQIMLADEMIGYPYLKGSHIFVALSQPGYDRYISELREDGILVFESELVTPDEKVPNGVGSFGIPAFRLTEENFTRKIVFNMVVLGFLLAHCDVVSLDAARKSVEESVPDGTKEMNLKAFDLGYSYRPSPS